MVLTNLDVLFSFAFMWGSQILGMQPKNILTFWCVGKSFSVIIGMKCCFCGALKIKMKTLKMVCHWHKRIRIGCHSILM